METRQWFVPPQMLWDIAVVFMKRDDRLDLRGALECAAVEVARYLEDKTIRVEQVEAVIQAVPTGSRERPFEMWNLTLTVRHDEDS